jgi:hypothetical protein
LATRAISAAARLVGHEVEHEARDDTVERAVGEGQRLGVGLPEFRPIGAEPLPGEVEEAGRRVDPDEAAGRAALGDRLGHGTGAAADLEPIEPGRRAEPGEELLRHRPAPSPDVALVEVAARPAVLHVLRDHPRGLHRPPGRVFYPAG